LFDAVCVGPEISVELVPIVEADVGVGNPVEVDNSEVGSSEVAKETTLEHGSAGFVGGSAVGKGIPEITRPGGSSEPPGPGGQPKHVGQGIGLQAGKVMPNEMARPEVNVTKPPVGVAKTRKV